MRTKIKEIIIKIQNDTACYLLKNRRFFTTDNQKFYKSPQIITINKIKRLPVSNNALVLDMLLCFTCRQDHEKISSSIYNLFQNYQPPSAPVIIIMRGLHISENLDTTYRFIAQKL